MFLEFASICLSFVLHVIDSFIVKLILIEKVLRDAVVVVLLLLGQA
jgi:hypothetical protein